MDLKALGFDIAEGVNDPYLPGDCGIFVTRVDKGSVADGRLRYERPGGAVTHFFFSWLTVYGTLHHSPPSRSQSQRLAAED